MKIKQIILIAMFLLTLSMVSAESFTLDEADTIFFKGQDITLIKIGSTGSAHLNVGEKEIRINRGLAKIYNGLRIKVIETEGITAEIEVTLVADCLTDKDCDDGIACTKDQCLLRECKYTTMNGCPIEHSCYPIGSIEQLNGESMYCAEDIGWVERKQYKSPCTHNHECLSNYCDKYCRYPPESENDYIKGGKKMAPAWILIAIGLFIILKYILFVIDPERAKRINQNYLNKFSNLHFRYIGIISIAIALAMIIWAII